VKSLCLTKHHTIKTHVI